LGINSGNIKFTGANNLLEQIIYWSKLFAPEIIFIYNNTHFA